jgi:hypothetical protein
MKANLLAAVAASGLIALGTGSTAKAAVTIGQTGQPSVQCAFNEDFAQMIVSSGNPYVVPPIPSAVDLSITSWTHLAHSTPNQRLKFKVYRRVTGLTYTVIGQDVQGLISSALNTFATNIRVQPGDILGLTTAHLSPATGCATGEFTEQLFHSFTDTPPGAQVTFETSPSLAPRLNISAVVEPTNAFSFAGMTRNKKKGSATLTFNLPNPGELTGSGGGAKVAGMAATSKAVPAGQAKLVIRAKGKKKRKLNETGKVKVNPTIAYTPTGGTASTQPQKVKLKKKL